MLLVALTRMLIAQQSALSSIILLRLHVQIVLPQIILKNFKKFLKDTVFPSSSLNLLFPLVITNMDTKFTIFVLLF